MKTMLPIDIAAAAYQYLRDNHSGQHSSAYRTLSRLLQVYTPGFGVEKGESNEDMDALKANWEVCSDVEEQLEAVGILKQEYR